MNSDKLREWVRPGIYNGLQKLSIPLFGVLSTALLAHKALTKPEMGVWANFLALTTFVEMFRSGFVRYSLVKYLNFSDKENHSKIMSSAFILNLFISFVLAVVLLITSGHIESFLKSPGLGLVLDIYALVLFIMIFFSHMEWLMYAHLSFKSLFLMYLVRQGSTFFGILIYYILAGKTSLETLVLIYSGGILLGTIAGYFRTRHLFAFKLIYSKYWLGQLWNFGKYVFGSNVSNLVFKNADQLLLSNLTSNTGIVASLNISRRVINIADIPSQIMGDVLFPKSSRPELSTNAGRTKYYYEKAVGASLAVILPVLLMLLVFPKILILLIAGREYLDAIPYLRLIALSIFTQAFMKQFGVIMDSVGYPHINFRVVTVIAVLMIIFCLLFIPRYHLMGAGFALIATQISGFIISMIVLYRYFRISILNTLRYCILFYPELVNIAGNLIRSGFQLTLKNNKEKS